MYVDPIPFTKSKNNGYEIDPEIVLSCRLKIKNVKSCVKFGL